MKFIQAKTIVSGYSENNSWFGNNYNMNIYKGCCHGCIYCDSRSECYHIENFDEVRTKENALALIERDLKSKRKIGVIGMGAMSDPYNPFEKELKLTRGALELIHRYGFGVSIATKSNLIERDVDVLKKISSHSPVLVKITITTADDNMCKKIEPNAALSSERFVAIKKLTEVGIFTGILLMPVLPFIQDNQDNIMRIIELAHKNGARFIYPAFGVTLRQNQRDWYFRKLDELFPGTKEKYIKQFGNAYECRSPKAKELWNLFQGECRRLRILYKMSDIIKTYKQEYKKEQLSFL
ncbi:radical SAM superfamily protein [Clostridium homopropionicum DSM 5847]|uniref:Radical SAM superfamily protein n=1 Tax=Clostridium homopropionicum DSM 5847 TaxID=1121318 RepID=A0A0L6Z6R3_9CLOT|nr:radical SAM protein [Clostridium homopropionicum]KOA18657.1 radical SAM superfamily protein [Clostridium homopropionicum DSM 5847]SFG51647.1 DNA repair photolyase [Clostridium homopropionicum]